MSVYDIQFCRPLPSADQQSPFLPAGTGASLTDQHPFRVWLEWFQIEIPDRSQMPHIIPDKDHHCETV